MCKHAHLQYSCGHTSDRRWPIIQCPPGECSGLEISAEPHSIREECTQCERMIPDAEAARDSEYVNPTDVETIVRRFHDAGDMDGLNEFMTALRARTTRQQRRIELAQQRTEQVRQQRIVLQQQRAVFQQQLDSLRRGNEQLHQRIRAAENEAQPPLLRRSDDHNENELQRMVSELQDPEEREREWNELQLSNQAELQELNEVEENEHEAQARRTAD